MVQLNVTPGLRTQIPGFLVQGWIAAMVHHIFVTIALGSDITFSIVDWTLSNLVYILYPFTALNGILLFNATYVIIYASLCLISRLSPSSSSNLFTMSFCAIVAFQLGWSLVGLIMVFGRMQEKEFRI
jgi:hypothetical protein